MKIDINTLVRQVAAERDIEPDKLIEAITEAIASAARKHYKQPAVRCEIEPESGEVSCWSIRRVVEAPDEDETGLEAGEIVIEDAKAIKADVEVGDELVLEALDTDQLGRIAAQSARQVLFQRVREAERSVIFQNYIQRVGEMLNGIVKRVDHGAVIVELGDTEGIIPRNHQVRQEHYSSGDRIKAVVVEVTMDASRPQVVLSRTDNQLLIKMLEMEVPEIYDGTVIVKKCIREPGERSKVAVFSKDRDIDPVGACVGLKGSRVQAITRELKGEKIDIIPWNSDLVSFAQNALAPAKINRVAVREEPVRIPVLDQDGAALLDDEGQPIIEESKEIVLDVIVGTEQLSLAIGRRGQNVRLASKLLNSRIEIKSEDAVKDELASALASMLRDMEGIADEPAVPEVQEIDYDLLIPLEEMEMITDRLRERLEGHGIHTAQDVLSRNADELSTIPGIGPVTAQRLIDMVQQTVDKARAEAAEAKAMEE